MFDHEGLPELRAVYWRNLKPGMVFVKGVTINGSVPYELRSYPVITDALRDALEERYQFLRDRSVLIYAPDVSSLSPREISERLRRSAEEVRVVNDFRAEFLRRRTEILGGAEADAMALDSSLVHHDSLILDHWSSGINAFDIPGGRPSLLRDLRASVTLSEVLTGSMETKFRFPVARPFQLHLVVDASYSMKASGRDDIVRDTLLLFDQWVRRLYPQAQLRWHAFSETCAPLTPPFRRLPIARGETRYESFVRSVLHACASDLPATVLLFTDGVPSDLQIALDSMRRFARLGIDYTQVVFRIAEEGFGAAAEGTRVVDGFRQNESDAFDPFPPDEQARQAQRVRLEFSELAIAAGGNQIILTLDRALGVVAVEAFDRWLGAFSSN
ncbi:MAG: hypothetical protein ABSG21_02800 [Spirochaetia bacterium]|jgi:hypothetical protein